MSKFAMKLIAAIAGLFLVALFLSVAAGEPVPPLQAFQRAKASGLLPAWVDVSDRVRLIPRWPTTALLCIEDRGTQNRLTLVGGLDKLVTWYDTGLIEVPTTWSPAAPADIATCFPQPAVKVPKALGEPVYQALVHTKAASRPYWRKDTPYDWTVMNAVYLVRASTPGEACGTKLAEAAQHVDATVAWHNVRGGMTRCRPA